MSYKSEAFRKDTKVEGRYLNYFKICSNNFEFVLSINHFYPENEHAQLHTRIVTSPYTCKCPVRNHSERSIEQYEESFGIIYRLSDKEFHCVISRRRITNTPSSFYPCEINYLKVYMRMRGREPASSVITIGYSILWRKFSSSQSV